MSLKTKLTSLITTFVLLCSLLTVGVFAVKNTTFNVGGDIVFNVQGIEATITRNSYAGFVTTNDKTIGDGEGNVLSKVELDNDMTASEVEAELASWTGLELAFDNATTATINLTIKNEAQAGADNYLDITALSTATAKNNARINVVNDAGGITALLEPQQSATFTITFSVIDDEYSASLEGFSVNFDMQKKVLDDFPELDEDGVYETLIFTTNVDGESVSVVDVGAEDYDWQSTGAIEIPAYVNINGNIYAVSKIGVEAFGAGSVEGYAEINSVLIPNTVTSIGDYAFSGCNLSNITIPRSVTSIGSSAFWECDNLASIEIPDSVTSIEGDAFYECTGLTTITIPDSLTSIGTRAFKGCSNLTTVYYTGTQDEWNAITIESDNAPLTNATKVYNYTGA